MNTPEFQPYGRNPSNLLLQGPHRQQQSSQNQSAYPMQDNSSTGRSVAVVAGDGFIESQAIVRSDRSYRSPPQTPRTPQTSPEKDHSDLHKVLRHGSKADQNEKQQRAKKVFWACFCSQLIVILILVIVWSSRASFLVEQSFANDAGSSANGVAQVLLGINETYRIDSYEELLGLSDDDYFGDGSLCAQGVDTPIAVFTDKPCYERPDDTDGAYSEPIAVMFENCAPQPDDWIGIYDASHNIFQPGIHRVDYWSWACGDQDCQTPVRGGIVVFAGVQEYGDFKVHLHRRQGEAEEMYLASSETFTVQATCA